MVGEVRVRKIVLDRFGQFLGMEEGCFIIKDKEGNTQKYPLFEEEIGEVVLTSGNWVSVGALASLGWWEIDTLIVTRKGMPVAMLKSIDDDSHVETRIGQYEALKNGKGLEIAKRVVYAKVEGQSLVLRKHGLRQHDLMATKERIDRLELDDLKAVRRKLLPIEGRCTHHYFSQIFQLFPKTIRAENRKTFKAYDGVNNTFNLGYSLLKWKVYRAVVRAKLEPYLGFLHSEQWGKPSLVCDFMELYRYLVDDFLIRFCKELRRKDFVMKGEDKSKGRRGKREFLNGLMTKDLMKEFNGYFEGKVEVPRIRHGFSQTLETLVNEEALLLAKYLRDERKTWIPRIAVP